MGDAHLTHDNKSHDRPPAIDMERFRLRRLMDDLRGTDELEICEQPTSLLDVAALWRAIRGRCCSAASARKGLNLWAIITSSRSRFRTCVWRRVERPGQRTGSGCANQPQVIDIPEWSSSGPGGRADRRRRRLHQMPVNLQHARDGGLYISAGLDYALDAKTGWTNPARGA